MGQGNSSSYLPLTQSFDLDELEDDDDEVELFPGKKQTRQILSDDSEDSGTGHEFIPKVIDGYDSESEGLLITFFQILFPFLVAGMGMVAAGLVLDKVQHWCVFLQVSELMILVPALLGLKGNLEMTLASRLSTAANLGRMDDSKEAFSLIACNLALVQVQGITVGFLASLTGLILGWRPAHLVNWDHGLLLCASSVVTASLASLLLGLVMVLVIMASRRFNINPDNVATPIAASLGDLVTLSLLAWLASLLWADLDKDKWLAPTIISFYLLVIPVFVWVSWRHSATRPIVISGWTPVLLAMLISSGGGFILKGAAARFPGIAVFQPVMNGVGGNLVAVQASRMTTSLHSQVRTGPGSLPHGSHVCLWPWRAICPCSSDPFSSTAFLLLSLVVPGHAVFTYTITLLEAGHTTPSFAFLSTYLAAALLQVALLLYICRMLVYWSWSRGSDPDNSAIPYLTALGDLLGGLFLFLAFLLLSWMGLEAGVTVEESFVVVNATSVCL